MSTSYNTYQITVDTLPDKFLKSSQGKGTPKTYQLELQVVDFSMCAPAFTVFEWGLDGDKHYSRLTRETRILNCNGKLYQKTLLTRSTICGDVEYTAIISREEFIDFMETYKFHGPMQEKDIRQTIRDVKREYIIIDGSLWQWTGEPFYRVMTDIQGDVSFISVEYYHGQGLDKWNYRADELPLIYELLEKMHDGRGDTQLFLSTITVEDDPVFAIEGRDYRLFNNLESSVTVVMDTFFQKSFYGPNISEEDASGIKENIRLEIVSRIWNSRGFKEFQEAERGVIITEFYKLLIDMFDAYEEKKENLKEEHL